VSKLVYRPMGEDFILPVCPQILLNGPIDKDDPSAFRSFVSECPSVNLEFFCKFISESETCAILAWDGNLIVGAVTFFPQKDLPPKVGKIYAIDDYPTSWWQELSSDWSTLVIACVTVAKGYRGMGIARGLIKEMIRWAKASKWKRLLINGVQTELLGYNHKMALPLWEDLGFKIIRIKNRAAIQPSWAARMKSEIIKKHEMGEYVVAGIDFGLLLKNLGWEGILASYDLALDVS